MVESREEDVNPDQSQRRPIYPLPTPPPPEQTQEEIEHYDCIKSIDDQLFGHIFEEVGEYRNKLKLKQYKMHQKIASFATKLLECVQEKLQELQEFRVVAETCFKTGNQQSLLDLLRQNLAKDSQHKFLYGKITDYTDASGLVTRAHLQKCIKNSIEACRDLLDPLTRKMHPDWKKEVLLKLQVPYAEMDQILRHLIEKKDVETNSKMSEKKDAANQTLINNLENRIRDLPPESPEEVRNLQNEVDGQKYVCTFPRGDKFAQSVMLLDANSQEARLIENPCLDVQGARSVVVKKALIIFTEGSPVAA